MSAKTETLTAIIEPVVQSFGMQLWGLQYAGQAQHALLRVFIDSENAVSVNDCAAVSRQLSAVLDVEDPISSKYTLEISSPGIDRPLFKIEHYALYIGSEVKIKLSTAIEKRRKYRATLLAVDEERQTLDISFDEQTLTIDLLNIEKANVLGESSINKVK